MPAHALLMPCHAPLMACSGSEKECVAPTLLPVLGRRCHKYGFLALSKFRVMQGSVFESQGYCRADFEKIKSEHDSLSYEKFCYKLIIEKNRLEVLRLFKSCPKNDHFF